MMQSTHKPHNEKVWDYEASQNHAQKMIKDHTNIILNSNVPLKNTIAAHKLVGEKFQMKIIEIGGREIESEEDMGGDLNCLEPMKIEYFKEILAT